MKSLSLLAGRTVTTDYGHFSPGGGVVVLGQTCSTVIPLLSAADIRIYHECDGRIEKSFPRIAVWHHKACRVMTKGDT